MAYVPIYNTVFMRLLETKARELGERRRQAEIDKQNEIKERLSAQNLAHDNINQAIAVDQQERDKREKMALQFGQAEAEGGSPSLRTYTSEGEQANYDLGQQIGKAKSGVLQKTLEARTLPSWLRLQEGQANRTWKDANREDTQVQQNEIEAKREAAAAQQGDLNRETGLKRTGMLTGAMDRRTDMMPTVQQIRARRAVQKEWQSGKQAQNLISIRTTIDHADALLGAVEALNNGDMTSANKFINTVRREFGDPAVGAADTTIFAVAREAARAFQGAGVLTDEEKREVGRILTSNASPELIKSVIEQNLKLLYGRGQEIRDQYKLAMQNFDNPDEEPEILSPTSQEVISRRGITLSGPGRTAPPTAQPQSNDDLGTMSEEDLRKIAGY